MKLYSDGNYAEAYDGIRRLVLSKDADPAALSGMIGTAANCLEQLNRLDEVDAFREEAVAAHPDDWQLLAQVAQSYVNTTNYGFMIAGEFHRGSHRGGGRVMNAAARDRVRALQLLRQAIQQVEAAHEQSQAGW